MRQLLLVVSILAPMLAGCGPSPERVVTETCQAYADGDMEGFLDGFTQDSRVFIEGMMAVDPHLGQGGMFAVGALTDSSCTVIAAKPYEALYRVTVASPTGPRHLLLSKGDDGWKLDLFVMEQTASSYNTFLQSTKTLIEE